MPDETDAEDFSKVRSALRGIHDDDRPDGEKRVKPGRLADQWDVPLSRGGWLWHREKMRAAIPEKNGSGVPVRCFASMASVAFAQCTFW